ncbi:MAG: hypothetical protein WD317_06105, partial [Balneolaceae bacterium]
MAKKLFIILLTALFYPADGLYSADRSSILMPDFGVFSSKSVSDERDAPDQPPPDLVDYTLFHDFETGELFGWEPYPYAQDT